VGRGRTRAPLGTIRNARPSDVLFLLRQSLGSRAMRAHRCTRVLGVAGGVAGAIWWCVPARARDEQRSGARGLVPSRSWSAAAVVERRVGHGLLRRSPTADFGLVFIDADDASAVGDESDCAASGQRDDPPEI